MQFVYGFIPKEKSLEKMIERRANELARSIVKRTSLQMDLEDQKVNFTSAFPAACGGVSEFK